MKNSEILSHSSCVYRKIGGKFNHFWGSYRFWDLTIFIPRSVSIRIIVNFVVTQQMALIFHWPIDSRLPISLQTNVSAEGDAHHSYERKQI